MSVYNEAVNKRKAERRLEQLDKIISKLYEDRAFEKISEERYISMNSKYEAEYIKLSERAKQSLKQQTNHWSMHINSWIW